LVRWFESGKHNIAIVTGAISGFSIIDLDGQKAIELAQSLGIPTDAPRVKTGKGYHIYCQFQDGQRNFQGIEDLPNIDFRSEGGYVLAPPSLHARGNKYEWVIEPAEELPQVPEWVLKPANKNHSSDKKTSQEKTNTGSRNMSLTREIGRFLRIEVDATRPDTMDFAHRWNELN
jgi:hypothetical protein